MESDGAEDVLAYNTLVLEIMQRVTNARMRHAQMLIHLVKQHRHKARLPVVTVNDIWMLTALEHELQRGAAKEREALVVVVVAVKDVAIEKLPVVVWVNEETLASVNEAEEHGTMNYPVVP